MTEHQEKHLQSSDLLTDIVIGMSDGLTVPFALAAGLSSAVSSNAIVIMAGIAEICAGSIAMGLGGYLAGRTEVDHYNSELKREYDEVEKIPDQEKKEVKNIFKELGISESSSQMIAEEIAKDKKKWVDFMMQYELGLDEPNPKRARNSAINIGLSYIAGGLVPLSPYFFTTEPITGLKYSCAVTILCLFIFGYFKSKITGQNPWWGAFRVMAIGSLAAAAAFFVASLFNK
jgi:vacuolar iron transporter family protein